MSLLPASLGGVGETTQQGENGNHLGKAGGLTWHLIAHSSGSPKPKRELGSSDHYLEAGIRAWGFDLGQVGW